MTEAYKNLKTGIKADIIMMVERNFINVDRAIIEDIFMCMHIMKIGRNTVSDKAWMEAWHLYGLSSYARITAHLEKQMNPNQRSKLHMLRCKGIEDKRKGLKAHVALPPYLARKMGLDNNNSLIERPTRALT